MFNCGKKKEGKNLVNFITCYSWQIDEKEMREMSFIKSRKLFIRSCGRITFIHLMSSTTLTKKGVYNDLIYIFLQWVVVLVPNLVSSEA